MDWSSSNVLAVGLGTCIYLWSATTGHVNKLHDLGPNDQVTSVQWQAGLGTGSDLLAIGTHLGTLQIWDTVKAVKVREIGGHSGRICTIAWASKLLATGSRDRTILQRDLRSPDNYSVRMVAHRQEICGLKWSFDGQQLASGGNDNKLMIWNARQSAIPEARFD